ncbi:MAG: hypothetical protein IKL59_07550 [Clostridia bacterium]|nr:hypothetical protein [Clostridia bacterium]
MKETIIGDLSKATTSETDSEDMANQSAMAEGEANNASETEATKYPDDYYYTIKEVDGKWYMDFDSYVTPTVSVEGSIMQMDFSFDSFEHMFNTIIVNKDLVKKEKIYLIDYATKTENGIEIINFDDLYVPVLPSSMEILSISWFADTYGTVVKDKASGKGIGRVTYCRSSEVFDEMYSSLVPDENNYILNEGDKTIIVEIVQAKESFFVDLYIKQGDRYCTIILFDLTELPTDEFFIQFGLEKWEKPE